MAIRDLLPKNYRITALVAVVAGAAIGASAAVLMAQSSEQPAMATLPDARIPFPPLGARARPVPGRPSSAAASATQPAASASSITRVAAPLTAPSAVSAASAALPVWKQRPLEAGRESLERAQRRCARGSPDDCMRVGVAYLHGHTVAPDESQARLFLGQARKIYTRTCRKRDPGACLALSHIFSGGVGVDRDARNAEALLERARRLCQARSTPVCDQLR